jgi:hypothetical protein
VPVGERNREKTYKDDEIALLFEREWNIEKIRGIASGMTRKERGIMRKKLGAPSGMVRKIPAVQNGRSMGDKEWNVKDLRTFCFSEFHSHVH